MRDISDLDTSSIIQHTNLRDFNFDDIAPVVGQKTVGLMTIPEAWRPPFGVLAASFYSTWNDALYAHEREEIITRASKEIMAWTHGLDPKWDRGIILRSSATKETINERGAYDSRPLTADFSEQMIGKALDGIFENFKTLSGDGDLAIIVQPFVRGRLGHGSNVRRISKTINQWQWSFMESPHEISRFNANRYDKKHKNIQPDPALPFKAIKISGLSQALRQVARWCISLNKGPALLEWCWDGGILWLLQLDFEDGGPDLGYDPKQFHRDMDLSPSGKVPDGSFLIEVDPLLEECGWGKIDKVKNLIKIREDRFPPLFLLKGDDVPRALLDKTKLAEDIFTVTNGRAVCRTDCCNTNIRNLNLPRTDSMSSEKAVEWIEKTYNEMLGQNINGKDICFVIHKFIPALACAWALAYPDKQLVKIDSLWGVPDGLQFFPHDSFDVDVKVKKIAERYRYKPFFIQELDNGEWKRIAVKRNLARGTSISRADLLQIAEQTQKLAINKNEPVLLMWFCDVPDQLKIGRNIPWFTMKPEEGSKSLQVAPKKPIFFIKNTDDLERAKSDAVGHILLLEPEVQLIRNNDFLDQIITLAKQNNLPVQVQGSSLCHAYYMLQQAGVEVYPSDTPKHTRTRGKRVFGKMVRDAIPQKIIQGGEQVILAKIHKHESRSALIIKLFEEAFELQAAETPEQVQEELADVLEVVRSLTKATGADWEEVEAASLRKREERGSFHDNVVLIETSWSSDKPESVIFSQPVPLHSLSKVKKIENGFELSFLTLLAHPEGTKITLPSGNTARINLSSQGLRIVEHLKDEQKENLQLPFNFSDFTFKQKF